MRETILLTGATGFLGMEVLVRVLERSDADVLALVRAADADQAQRRLDAVMHKLYDRPPARFTRRVRALAGDLRSPGFGLGQADLDLISGSTEAIAHCAASVAFDSPLPLALSDNTLGTARILELAEQVHAAGRLRRMIHVSTAFVCGCHDGRFEEADLDLDVEFRNNYERSKAYAEHILRRSDPTLPVTIARPSIVVGDSSSGWTPTFNVIYWPMRAYERGLLDTIPGSPAGRLDIVPVDYVADALFALLIGGYERRTVHLVAGDLAVSNEELAELASRHIGRATARFAEASTARSLEEMLTFVPYMNITGTFANSQTSQLLDGTGIKPASVLDYLHAILAYAKRSRWGKRPLTREAAARLSSVGP